MPGKVLIFRIKDLAALSIHQQGRASIRRTKGSGRDQGDHTEKTDQISQNDDNPTFNILKGIASSYCGTLWQNHITTEPDDPHCTVFFATSTIYHSIAMVTPTNQRVLNKSCRHVITGHLCRRKTRVRQPPLPAPEANVSVSVSVSVSEN